MTGKAQAKLPAIFSVGLPCSPPFGYCYATLNLAPGDFLRRVALVAAPI
ncbi:hypothetical protein BN1221_00051c [Brenneria goodwinii]|uniref:Uncharacterized protein n=1 Tax=Brenneria goodwinii TaxID=1109412 RepID=A0A0G4JP26_9GAMM|nr:hypothetical protein BN1221_00051c [Brenneria goodwinii]